VAYYIVQDFAGGLDRRKSAITAKPGSLRELTNGFVNAGGEIEKRYTLTKIGIVSSSNTHGLAFHQNQLYVFGTVAPGDVTAPAWVTYQRLVPDTPGPTITRVLRVQTFGTQLYVSAKMSDGAIMHFLDGVQVTDQNVTGATILSYLEKVFAGNGSDLRASAVGDATVWDPLNSGTPGAAIIDMQKIDGTGGDIMALAPYYSFLAVISRTSAQIWAMDPDPDLSQQIQALGSTGCIAYNAAARYANGDVLFLSDSGIRSLRARDSSNAAVFNDIGSPIDSLIRDKRIAEFTSPEDAIFCDTDPMSGHWWLAWGNEAFVLSYYPASKVSAWARFAFPFTVDYLARGSSRMFIRSGDDIYVYGAIEDGGDPLDDSGGFPAHEEWYDDTTELKVVTPLIDCGDPAKTKRWQALDIACDGVWDVCIATDPLQPDVWTQVGTLSNTSYSQGQFRINGLSTHIAVKLTSTSANARLGAVAVHYEDGRTS
jgi:hypothetical protein